MQINIYQNKQVKTLKPWQQILVGLLFMILGIIFLFIAVKTINSYNEKNKTYIETNSVVVGYDYDDEGLQAIIVEYKVNGRSYTKTSNSYSNMPKERGTKVKIKYNPNKPKDAIWVKDSTNIILPIISGLFILIGLVVTIFGFIRIKKEKENSIIESNLSNKTDTPSSMNNSQSIEQNIQNENLQYQQPISQNQNNNQNNNQIM